MRLLVARHGKTQWNEQGRVCGRADIPLAQSGIEQAERLAQEACSCHVDVILSSPLQRALQTSRIVAQACGCPVVVDERLIEQDYGCYDGVARQNGDFLENKRQFAYRYPGGESMMQVAARVYALLDEIRRRYAGQTALIVSHGGVCRISMPILTT